MDDNFAKEWVKIFRRYSGIEKANDLKKAVVLFFDNLGSQTRRDFKRQLKKWGIFAHYYPAGCTDLVQVVDARAEDDQAAGRVADAGARSEPSAGDKQLAIDEVG